MSEFEFFYDETPAEDGHCPSHVERLRKSLLDFSCPRPRGAFFKDSVELDSVLAGMEGKTVIDIRLVPSYVIRQEAIETASQSSSRVESFYNQHFFKRLASSALHGSTNARMQSRAHFYYDAIVVDSPTLWRGYFEIDGDLEYESREIGSLAFSLPIYGTTGEDISKPHTGERWPGPPDPASAAPFTWNILSSLSVKGLRPFQIAPEILKLTKPGCYPWLVGNIFSSYESAEKGLEVETRRTTRTAALALKMQRHLTKYSTSLGEESHVLPVTAMTAAGPNVTIWVAYYAKNFILEKRFRPCYWDTSERYPNAYIMQAIWKGDMTKLRDVIELEMLLENIYTWAVRVFKPYVATCLHQWRSQYPEAEAAGGSLPTEAGTESLPERHSRRNSLSSVGSAVESDVDSPSQLSKYTSSALNPEKLLEDINKLMEQRIQKLIQNLGLSPARSEDIANEGSSTLENKVADPTGHIGDGVENGGEAESHPTTTLDRAGSHNAKSRPGRAPWAGSSSDTTSSIAPFFTIPAIESPNSSTISEKRKDDAAPNRPASALLKAENRVILSPRRPMSTYSIAVNPYPEPSTDETLTVELPTVSARHLSPNTSTFTPQRPASADGSLRTTNMADKKLNLDPDNHLGSSLRLPTGDFFGLAGAENLGDRPDSAQAVFDRDTKLPAALMNWAAPDK